MELPFSTTQQNCKGKMFTEILSGPPAGLRRPSNCCWLDWNWVWKLWSAKLCAVLVQCQGKGCFWDTRIHCWAFWRLCGLNSIKAAMMEVFSFDRPIDKPSSNHPVSICCIYNKKLSFLNDKYVTCLHTKTFENDSFDWISVIIYTIERLCCAFSSYTSGLWWLEKYHMGWLFLFPQVSNTSG